MLDEGNNRDASTINDLVSEIDLLAAQVRHDFEIDRQALTGEMFQATCAPREH
jgi:hypothetical protein